MGRSGCSRSHGLRSHVVVAWFWRMCVHNNAFTLFCNMLIWDGVGEAY